jgi:hypothetical protein
MEMKKMYPCWELNPSSSSSLVSTPNDLKNHLQLPLMPVSLQVLDLKFCTSRMGRGEGKRNSIKILGIS